MHGTWFDTARFGMFVHWGHSSQQGIEISWPLVGAVFALPQSSTVTVGQYHSSAATFNPTAYDPRSWARMAKRMGMQYAVFTTKHHDGYAMFDTKTSDFGVMHSPYGRDIFREFADAMRDEGIRVGVYFSLADWHHPDYPAFTQADQPYRFPVGKALDPATWPRFVDTMFEQVRELLTNYGTIDLIWFDGGWERTPEQWRAKELEAMIRTLQPEIRINERLPGGGDFDTPEQFVPAQPPARAWETCMTINESWAYNPRDTHFKSPRRLIDTLCEVAGKGGNLLLNIGPMGDGQLQPELTERLAVIERWMERNSESILDTTPALQPWQFYGPTTRKANRVYLHCLMRPYDTVTVRGVRVRRVRAIRALASGEELKYAVRTAIVDMLFKGDSLGELTIEIPPYVVGDDATVIAIDFDGDPV
jgi:alpha-L-fucosidase